MVDLIRMLKESVLLKETRWPTFDGHMLNRNDFVTASEASGCARKLAYSKRTKFVSPKDVTDDEYELLIQNMNATSSDGFWERGHAIEAWAIKTLRTALMEGEMLLLAGNEQVSFYNEELKVSGTPDGIFFDPEDPINLTLLEIKSVGNLPSKPKDGHILQIQINMSLINGNDERIAEIIGCPHYEDQRVMSAKIVYIESNNYMAMAEYRVKWDGGAGLTEAYEKARKVFVGDEVHKPQNVAPEGLETGDCWFCPFKRPCRMIQESENQAVPDEGLPNMPRFQEPSAVDQSLLDRYGMLYEEAARTSAELAEHKKLVMELFETTPEYENRAGASGPLNDYSMTIRTTDRTSLDKAKVVSFVDANGGNMNDLMTTTTIKPGLYMNKRK